MPSYQPGILQSCREDFFLNFIDNRKQFSNNKLTQNLTMGSDRGAENHYLIPFIHLASK